MNHLRVFIFLVLLAIAPGCKPRDDLLPVQGSVKCAGKPVPLGYVVLTPDIDKGNESQHEPRAHIEPDGRYRVHTNLKDGAPPGWYILTVNANRLENPNDPYKFKPLVPERYNDVRKSGLRFEVTKNPRPEQYDLNLEAK